MHLTEDAFLDLVQSFVGKYQKSRLEKYRSAVKHEQIAYLPEEYHWFKTERFRARFSGMLKEAEALHRAKKSQDARDNGAKDSEELNDPDDGERGAIQYEKAVQVVLRSRELGMMMFARGAAVTYSGAFRHEEITEATLAGLKKEFVDFEQVLIQMGFY